MTLGAPAAGAGTAKVVDRASARCFVHQHVAPYAARFDRTQSLPQSLLKEMAAAGLWGLPRPRALGGGGADFVTLGHVHEEVGRGCSSVRSLLTVHTMVMWAVDRWGSTAQGQRWLPALAAGEVLGAFCLTEAEAGSDAANIVTTARRAGGDWLVEGHKRWITGGQVAGVFLVFARTDRGMSALLIPADAAGVEVEPVRDALGVRASMLANVRFQRAAAGPDALLGPEGFATATVMSGALDLGRYSVACGSVGLMQACMEACAAYASSRRSAGALLKDRQLIRAKLTEMVTAVRAARLLYEEAGRLKDERDQATIMATSIAKYFATTAASRVASDAVQIHGANGCSDRDPVARYYRDAKIAEIIEGSTEIQQIIIAEEALRSLGSPSGRE